MKTIARAAVVLLTTAGTSAAQTLDAAGTWLNADKDGIVQIGDCGSLRGQPARGALCGKVVWIRDALDRTTGRPPVDSKNSDPALRSRPIVGLLVLNDMKSSGNDTRWEGTVYNIDDGKTYSGKLTLLHADQLKVEGCVMMLCRGEIWTRQAVPR